MYAEFYHLRENPFTLTPSPRFLYLGEAHKEALALLRYAAVERKGFIVVTGDIGTGKTTMVQALLSSLDESLHSIHVANPLLSVREFLDYLASSAFHRKSHFKSKANFLVEFEEFLRGQEAVILIIDEAQNLSFALLEEIRLLSNMVSADEKLISIFLVGQPELNDKLRDTRCRALLQRISHRYHIPPLDLKGTIGYVSTRLKGAGAQNPYGILPKRTITAIYHYSGGYPRVINTLADNCLLLGYSRGKGKITIPMVEECFAEMSVVDSPSEGSRKPPVPYAIPIQKSRPVRRYWKWAWVQYLLIALLAFGVSPGGRNLLGKLSRLIPTTHRSPSPKTSPGGRQVKTKGQQEREGSLAQAHRNEQPSPRVPETRKGAEVAGVEKPKDPKRRLKKGNKEPSLALSVEKGLICRAIYKGRPVVVGKSFNSSVGRLCCFTKIVGARSPTRITHVWYFGDTMKARVKLKVKSSSWRTYSARTIKAHEVGEWQVAVLGPGGEVLKTVEFKITPRKKEGQTGRIASSAP